MGLFLAVVGVGALAWYASRVPIPPEAPAIGTTVIAAADGTRLASLDGGQDRTPVSLDKVPEVVRDAVLAAEDRKFYEHGGIDPLGITRAIWADLRNQGVRQGGSTITQQYVKNAYVGSDRSASRKGREAIIAVKLEQRMSKDQILERYLNAIYLGRGAYGVEAGSRAWFGRSVTELGPNEATYLAALIRSPETTAVDKGDGALAEQRRESVVANMLRSGTLDGPQANLVRDTPIQTYVVRRVDRPSTITNTDIGMEYVIDEVRRQLVARYTERVALGGGLKVTLTIDLERQRQAYDAVYGPKLPSLRQDEPAGALVSIDEKGDIVALVGGRDHGDSQVNLALGKLGGGSGRQPGSTFKPFLLADIVEEGGSVESSFPAPPKYVWKGGEGGADYPVGNYEGEGFGGSLNLVDATRLSVNPVYAQAAEVVGPARLVERASALGITSPMAPNASLVLGTAQVSPLEMASAYSTLARGGTRIPPRLLGEVTDADGGSIAGTRQDGPSRAVSEDTSKVVTEVLRRVVDKGTGTAARLDRPAAGKTGTTNNSTDAWFVGYTASPRLTTAVWMGWPDGSRPMDRVRGRPVSGGGIPAQIWEKYMAAATKGAPPGDFDEPPSLSEGNLLQGSGRDRAAPAGDMSPSPTVGSGPAATTAQAAAGGSTTSSTRPGRA
ncbi:MAG TPA: transglycosylase domain-containing protein, partial [Acidimicrobiales bacterium]|nr:transglycosylase domain-containing protein [Acidimicrobiales bacterium]